MGVPTSEVGYTPAMPTREDYEVHKGHVVGEKKKGTVTARKGFWKSLSLQRFPFYFYTAAEAYSRLCYFFRASLSPFDRCEEAEGGGESVSAVGNSGSLSLQ